MSAVCELTDTEIESRLLRQRNSSITHQLLPLFLFCHSQSTRRRKSSAISRDLLVTILFDLKVAYVIMVLLNKKVHLNRIFSRPKILGKRGSILPASNIAKTTRKVANVNKTEERGNNYGNESHECVANELIRLKGRRGVRKNCSSVRKSISIMLLNVLSPQRSSASKARSNAADSVHLGRGGFAGAASVIAPRRTSDASVFHEVVNLRNSTSSSIMRSNRTRKLLSLCADEPTDSLDYFCFAPDARDSIDVDLAASSCVSYYGGKRSPIFIGAPPPLPDYPILEFGKTSEHPDNRGGSISSLNKSNLPSFPSSNGNVGISSSPEEIMKNAAQSVAALVNASDKVHREEECFVEVDKKQVSNETGHGWQGGAQAAGEVHFEDSSPAGISTWYSREDVDLDEHDMIPGEEIHANPQNYQQSTRPIVYRYFGRSLKRTHSDHVPFILLSPSVEHWKDVGEVLASRGFSVMACETSSPETSQQLETKEHDRVVDSTEGCFQGDGESTVVAVLEALRWKESIVVGCDSGAVAALEAARQLNDGQIVGLVLCGNLREAHAYVNRMVRRDRPSRDDSSIADTSVDCFLQEGIACPGIIIWDGDLHALPKYKKGSKASVAKYLSEDAQRDLRVIIRGGGVAPHRRLPEQFAWVLTRFVEKLSSVSRSQTKNCNAGFNRSDDSNHDQSSVFPLTEIFLFNRVFSPEALLVSGRFVATAIAYVAAANVAVYQYHNIKSGMTFVGSKYLWLSSWHRQCWVLLGKIIAEDWRRKRGVMRSFIKLPTLSWLSSDTQSDEPDNMENIDSSEIQETEENNCGTNLMVINSLSV